jgi:hypothetical protein
MRAIIDHKQLIVVQFINALNYGENGTIVVGASLAGSH